MPKVVVCETMLKPLQIPIASSKGDGTVYTTIAATLFNDPVCDCPGFQFRGKCKHVSLLEDTRCFFHRPATEDDKDLDERCPTCRSPLVLFELDPELE
jgi:hypothetical protein